jgi:FkbM family methyltransferase
MLFIYGKKALGRNIQGADYIYLTYLFTLNRCDLRHIGEEKDYFKVVTSDGVFLYMRKYPSSDAQVLHQIWTEKEYEIVTNHIRENFAGKKLRIVDAGANVGYSSLYLFSRLKQDYDLEFIVIEPGENNLEMLKRNFEANGLPHYHIEKAGLFNKSCYLSISTDFRDGKDWSLRVEESAVRTDIKGLEVLDILQKYAWEGIDFFKIDIEGSERFLFEDERYASRFLEKVGLISIEIHDEFNLSGKIEKTLADNNYDRFSHGEITVGYNRKFKRVK